MHPRIHAHVREVRMSAIKMHTLLSRGSMYVLTHPLGRSRYEYLRTKTHTRTQRTYPHAYKRVMNDGSLHVNKTLAITRKAIVALTSLLNFGASSNAATTHQLAETRESHCARLTDEKFSERTLQTRERTTKNCS